MATANSPEELGRALRDDEDTIIVEGDLREAVIRIRAKGNVAWGVIFACLVIAVVLILSGGLAPAAVPVGGGAALALGTAGTAAAIKIAAAAGDAEALNKLRGYREVSRGPTQLVLKRA